MPFDAVKELKTAGTKFVGNVKGEPGEAEAREILKKLGPLEKCVAAYDKAYKEKKAVAIRSTVADLLNASKTFAGACQVLHAKLQKAKLEEAAAALGMLLAEVTTMVVGQAQLQAQAEIDRLKDRVLLPATTYSGDWQEAKKRFEALTGKKKPASSFLGAFRKSAGLDKACQELDKASKANHPPNFRKALVTFIAKSDAYMKDVAKECKMAIDRNNTAEGTDELMDAPTYNQCVAALTAKLNIIRKNAKELLKAAEEKMKTG